VAEPVARSTDGAVLVVILILILILFLFIFLIFFFFLISIVFSSRARVWMSVPVLVCECGMRVRAPGATPGRVGTCPRCGGRLVVPDERAAATMARGVKPTVVPEAGYGVTPDAPPADDGTGRKRRKRREATEGLFFRRPRLAAPSDGILAPLKLVETNALVSFSYPLRGAECLGVIALLSPAFWILAIVVPEYCVYMMTETDSMGVPTLGKFMALISFLPVLFLLPFVVLYWLQYLGRVLVSSAMGETAPPRSPDRNFEGFFRGLSPWVISLVLGLPPSLAPISAYVYTLPSPVDFNGWIALGFGLLGVPYMSIAFMLSFIHDNILAAMPWTVIGAILRVPVSFMRRCLAVVGALLLGIGAFALALVLRAHAFWIYLPVALLNVLLMLAILVVVMRMLGTFYYHHRSTLRWHRASPRWGIAWRI
jgi:hypothetical protein